MNNSEQKFTGSSFFRIALIVLGLLAITWFFAHKSNMPQNEINLLFGSAVVGIVFVGLLSFLGIKIGRSNQSLIKALVESPSAICVQCRGSFDKTQMRKKRKGGTMAYFCQSCYRKDEFMLAVIALVTFFFFLALFIFRAYVGE